jgi:O-antigen biosynthesis protein
VTEIGPPAAFVVDGSSAPSRGGLRGPPCSWDAPGPTRRPSRPAYGIIGRVTANQPRKLDVGAQPFAIVVLDLDLSEPIPSLPEEPQDARAVRCIVRLHGLPVGQVEVGPASTTREAICEAVWSALRAEIEDHLVTDGLQAPTRLTPNGIDGTVKPRCLAEFQEFLRRAPSVSVVIPTAGRPTRINACIRTLLACEYPPDRREIIVVDNAPAESEVLKLVTDGFVRAGVRYVHEPSPGSASARNRGVSVAHSDLVLFTDDDVVVDKQWLGRLAQGFDDPTVGVVTGLVLPLALSTPAQVWFEQYGGFSQGFQRRLYNLREHRPPDNPLYPYTAGVFGTGNNMAFRRSVLTDIGGFDPALGNGTPALGGVDSEVLLRTVLSGHTILYEPRALVWHEHRRDCEALRRQLYAYGTGLSAYLLKTMIAHPRLIPGFVARLPRGLAFALHPKSTKNRNKSADFPSELTRLELKGMLYGPIAYWRSRRRYGPHTGPGLRVLP